MSWFKKYKKYFEESYTRVTPKLEPQLKIGTKVKVSRKGMGKITGIKNSSSSTMSSGLHFKSRIYTIKLNDGQVIKTSAFGDLSI